MAAVLGVGRREARSTRVWRTTSSAAKKGKARAKKEKEESDLSRHEEFLKMVSRRYGPDIVVKMDKENMDVPTFSTGSLTLDIALGGGLPHGKIVEIYGKASSGKTTLALHIMASMQKTSEDARCAFIDAECAMDRNYAHRIGVDMSRWDLFSPLSAEEATDLATLAAEQGAYKVIVIDSVAALSPQEEIDKGMNEMTIGLLARVMSKFMRKIKQLLARTNTTLVLINQLRANIGGYGPAEMTTGGVAIGYYSTIRIAVRAPKSGVLGPVSNPHGVHCVATVNKNKLAAPFRTAEYDIIFGEGISWESSVLEAALQTNVLKMSGAWLEYEGIKAQGKEKFAAVLREDPDLCKRLEQHVRSGEDDAADKAACEAAEPVPA